MAVFDTFLDKSNSLVSQLESEVEHGKPIDLQEYFFQYTMVKHLIIMYMCSAQWVQDSFGLIAFDADFRTLEGETAEYGKAFDGAHECVASFFKSYALLASLLEVFHHKSLLRTAIETVVHPLIPQMRRLKSHRRVMREYTARVIADRKRDGNTRASKDILGRFIQSAAEQQLECSDDYLTDVVLNLIIAGRDTTACLLSWTFYELGRNPEVLSKLRTHLEDVDTDDFKTMKQHPYLTALLHEG